MDAAKREQIEEIMQHVNSVGDLVTAEAESKQRIIKTITDWIDKWERDIPKVAIVELQLKLMRCLTDGYGNGEAVEK